LKNFSKIFGFDFAIVEPMRESLFTNARSPKVLRSTIPLDYDNIIPQRARFVKRFWENNLRHFAQTFARKMVEVVQVAQKRRHTGRWRADEKRG
jgi:hypothetical protein